MNRSLWFPATLCLLLLAPAALYGAVGVHTGQTRLLAYLLPNYLFMAAPHLLVSLLAVRPRLRRPSLLWVLVLLNCVLVAFQLWVLLVVPLRESGLAWLYYIPLWVMVLLICGSFLIVLNRRKAPLMR